jgi:phage gpG-like protein
MMDGFQLTYTLDTAALDRKILGITTKLKDLSRPLTLSKDFILRETDQQWPSEGSHLGTPWKARTPQLGEEGSRVDTWPLLEKSGAMRKSFGFRSTKDSMTLFNTATYFPYHQSSTARRRLPHRPMLVLNNSLKESIVKIFQAELVQALR